MNGVKCTVKTLFLGLFNACFECSVRHIGYLPRIFPKAGRIGKSFLVLLGCSSGQYYLGTTLPLPDLSRKIEGPLLAAKFYQDWQNQLNLP